MSCSVFTALDMIRKKITRRRRRKKRRWKKARKNKKIEHCRCAITSTIRMLVVVDSIVIITCVYAQHTE